MSATALFGLADVWVIGRLGDVTAQGGVEIGAKLITALLILFNFLRSSTVALTARAAGRNDAQAQAEVLVRAVTLAPGHRDASPSRHAMVIPAGLSLYGAAGEVTDKARSYVQIRAWSGAPMAAQRGPDRMAHRGQRKVRSVLAVEVGSNLLHVALDTALVLHFRLGVSGVATATLCSESAKFLALGRPRRQRRARASRLAIAAPVRDREPRRDRLSPAAESRPAPGALCC